MGLAVCQEEHLLHRSFQRLQSSVHNGCHFCHKVIHFLESAADIDPHASIYVRLIDDFSQLSSKLAIEIHQRPLKQIEWLLVRYCHWPKPKRVLQLNLENVDTFQKSLPLNEIPQTFSDAIHITRSLDIRYLWIDTLCIIQDSPSDWSNECQRMGHVYENALCTIAAAAAANPYQGCFVDRNPYIEMTCKIAGSMEDGLFVDSAKYEYEQHESRNSRATSVLFQRGWVLQESILSQRILEFGPKVMNWVCHSGYATEANPDGSRMVTDVMDLQSHCHRSQKIFGSTVGKSTTTAQIFLHDLPDVYEPRLNFAALLLDGDLMVDDLGIKNSDDNSTIIDFHRCWFQLINGYSKCILTLPEDKLPAIAGLAKRIQECHGITYFAGLWGPSLHLDLLWHTTDSSHGRLPIPQAPTWSWASVNARIYGCPFLMHSLDNERHRKIAAAKIISVDINDRLIDRGKSLSEKLVVRGPLLRGKLYYQSSHRKLESRIFGIGPPFRYRLNAASFVVHLDICLEKSSDLDLLPLLRYKPEHAPAEQWPAAGGLVLVSVGENFEQVGMFYCKKESWDIIEKSGSYKEETVVIR
jgi:hypothetical protein